MAVITILEAHVAPENWKALERAYKSETEKKPPQLIQSFLIRSAADPTLWRIITVWLSREALEEMRAEGTPAGVLMFRAAKTEPSLSIFDVIAEVSGAKH